MSGSGRVEEHDDDPWELEDAACDPAWFPGAALPDHARRIGLTHHTQEGALLDFAHHLDGSRRYHRVVAWVLLVAFGFPVFVYVVRVLDAAYHWVRGG